MPTELIIGHRGSSLTYPENTMISFEKALTDGCNCFELDVAISSDGVPFIMHDDTLDRTTNGTGNCHEKTWEYIQGLDAGSWKNSQFIGEKVPSLEQVLDYFKGNSNFILIEIKTTPIYGNMNLPEKVAQLITLKGMENQCFVFSFDNLYVDRVKLYNTKIITGYLSSGDTTTIIASAVAKGHKFVSFEKSLITQQLIDTVHSNNLKINAWTVNSQTDVQNLINMGCDWISGDDTVMLKNVADINSIIQIIQPYYHVVYIQLNDDTLMLPLYESDKSNFRVYNINKIMAFELVDTTNIRASNLRIMTENGVMAVATL